MIKSNILCIQIQLELEELGDIRKIRLEHCDVKPGASWSVDMVRVIKYFTWKSVPHSLFYILLLRG